MYHNVSRLIPTKSIPANLLDITRLTSRPPKQRARSVNRNGTICWDNFGRTRDGSVSPLRQRVAVELREQIRTGAIKAGDKFPTEQELHEQYDVSRDTVRLALGLLQNEG